MSNEMSNVHLHEAQLRDGKLRGADLHGAALRKVDLHGADLHGADLSGADLSGADLSGADLSGADLSGADLRGARLDFADLRGAGLQGADLREAVIWGVKLDDCANFHGADLRGAHLGITAFMGAKLSCVDFRGTDLGDSCFARSALDGALLDKVHILLDSKDVAAEVLIRSSEGSDQRAFAARVRKDPDVLRQVFEDDQSPLLTWARGVLETNCVVHKRIFEEEEYHAGD